MENQSCHTAANVTQAQCLGPVPKPASGQNVIQFQLPEAEPMWDGSSPVVHMCEPTEPSKNPMRCRNSRRLLCMNREAQQLVKVTQLMSCRAGFAPGVYAFCSFSAEPLETHKLPPGRAWPHVALHTWDVHQGVRAAGHTGA